MLQKLFNDFASCFNEFTEREERLLELHDVAVKKGKELAKKMRLEVLA